MKTFIKNLSFVTLAALTNARAIKRDPYWIRMSDIIQQVRPDFYYGVVSTVEHFNTKKYQDILSSYNLYVPGNECKFYTIGENVNEYNFSKCDASFAFAKSMNAVSRGHTLFWPNLSPDWFRYGGKSSEVNREYIMEYVTKVLEHYKDEENIVYWDVVNEAVDDNSNSTNIILKYGKSKEFSGWDTYLEDIFTIAREHTNPNVKLCYNDYNAENNNGEINGKTGAVFNIVKDLKEKELIDCVGLQMHVAGDYYPNYEQLTQIISMYEEIGVEVHVTEIDVTMERTESLEKQREIYSDIFRACFDHQNCKVFTVWGARDAESWIDPKNTPLPFDDEMYPKDIYFDMLNYVMDQLPSNASYLVPTATTRPVTASTPDVPNATYLIVPRNYMVSTYVNNWSWDCNVSFDDDSNGVISYRRQGGNFALYYYKGFNAGTLHFEVKADQANVPIKVDIQVAANGSAQLISIIDDIPTDEFGTYEFKIPYIEGGYNRFNIRSVESGDVTLTIKNYYFIPGNNEIIEEEENQISTTTTIITSTDVKIVEPTTTIIEESNIEPTTTIVEEPVIEPTTVSVEAPIVEPTSTTNVDGPVIEPTIFAGPYVY